MLTKPYYGRLFFTADDGANAGNSAKPDENSEGNKPDDKKSSDPDEFKPITSESELAGWKGRTKKAIIEEVKADLAREQETKDRTAEEARQRDEEIKRGEFDKVRTDLESKLTAADSEKQALATKVERYEALTRSRVDAIKGELPAEAVEDFPAEADAIDQLEWLDGRQKLLAKLAPATQQNGRPRVPATPQPNAQPKTEATSLVSRHAI